MGWNLFTGTQVKTIEITKICTELGTRKCFFLFVPQIELPIRVLIYSLVPIRHGIPPVSRELRFHYVGPLHVEPGARGKHYFHVYHHLSGDTNSAGWKR